MFLIIELFIFFGQSALISKDQTTLYSEVLQGDLNFYVESGHISYQNSLISDNALFYQLFLKSGTTSINDIKEGDKFILWIEGGPGSASQDAIYNQHGPFIFISESETQLREYSWNKLAHTIYIDQPYGTGWSYWSQEELINNSIDAAKYVVDALEQFFEQHTIFKKCQFYIVGESYAGHYIPQIGQRIFDQKLNEKINYKGIMIGGAWSYPSKQLTQVGSQLFSFGMVDQKGKKELDEMALQSIDLIYKEEYKQFLELSDIVVFDYDKVGPNYRYNMQIYDADFDEYYSDFLNRRKEQFNSNIEYKESNQLLYKAFAKDQAMDVEQNIIYLIQKGKVLLFNGQFDTVITQPSALNWINQMKWDQIYEWKKQQKQLLTLNGVTYGNIKEWQNFQYATIYLGGHMTATDQPQYILIYGLEVTLISTVLIILFLPRLLKFLLRFHRKVISLDFTYFPFRLDDVLLRYKYKKHIEARIQIKKLTFSKVPNQWKLKLDFIDLQVKYIVKEPIRIGFIYEEQEYLNRLQNKLALYTPQRINKRINKCLSFMGLLVESIIANLIVICVSRMDMYFNQMTFTLPDLNSKDSDLPQQDLSFIKNKAIFNMNQNGLLECHFQCRDAALHENVADNQKQNPSVQIMGLTFKILIRPGLTIDMLQEHSSIETVMESVVWNVNREYYYTMDILANEFYPRPDVNKILKRYLNQKGFLYLSKPRDVKIRILDYKVIFQTFLESQHFVKYNYPLIFQWEDLSYHGKFDLIDDTQIKDAKISCKNFTISTMQQDFRIRQVDYTQYTKVSNSIHASDDTKFDISYGDVYINISSNFLRYMTLIQTEMGSYFREQFMENYEQKNYFNKYNLIAKQLCCDFLNQQLQKFNENIYLLKIKGSLFINIIDNNQIINQIALNNFQMRFHENIKTHISIDECNIYNSNQIIGSIFNISYSNINSFVKLVIANSNINIQHTNIQRLMRMALQYKIFRSKLLQKTQFKPKQERPESVPDQQLLSIILGNTLLSYECDNKMLQLKVKEVATLDPNKFSIQYLTVNYFNVINSQIIQCDNIMIELNQSVLLYLNEFNIQFDENVQDLNGFLNQIKNSQSFLQEYSLEEQNLNKQTGRRRATHDGVLTPAERVAQPKKVKAILMKQFEINISKFSIKVMDTKWNTFMTNYRYFQSKFELNKNRQNEQKIIEFLKKPRCHPLLNLELLHLNIKLEPQKQRLDQVLDRITELDSFPTLLDGDFFDQFQLFQMVLKIQNIKLQMRDYWNDIISLEHVTLKSNVIITRLNSLNLNLGLRLYYDLNISLHKFNIAVGFNLIHGIQELHKRVQIIMGMNRAQTFSLVQKSELPFWDRIRLHFHGKIGINCNLLSAKLLTDIHGYSRDCVQLKMKNIEINFLNWTIKAQSNSISLGRIPKINRVMNIPRIQVITEFQWNAKGDQFDHYFINPRPYFNQNNCSMEDFQSQKLNVNVKVDCIQYEYQQELKLKKQKDACFYIHYQNSFMRWLKNRPILRHDYLRTLPTKFQQVFDTPEVNQKHLLLYADYKSLMHYTYFKLIESLMIKQSLYKHTEVIDIKIYANKCRVLFTNAEKTLSHSESYLKSKDVPMLGTQSLLQSMQFNIQLEPNCVDGEWKFEMKKVSGKCSSVHGAMFDGSNLIDIDAPQSLNQQTEFVKFFDIHPTDFYAPISISELKVKSFQEMKKLKQFLKTSRIVSNTTVTAQYHLFDADELSFVKEEEDNEIETMRTRSTRITQREKRTEYDAFDLFLSAYQIEFEQNKLVELVDDLNKKESKLIKNFIQAQDCQLLFTLYLQDIWANIFDNIQIEQKSEEFIENQINQPEIIKEQSYTKEELTLLVSLVKPQLNCQYHTANCQMILTSPSDCQIIVSEYFLPFDKYKIDKKIVSKLIFNGLEAYILGQQSDVKGKTYFLSDKYQKIIKCDFALFQMQHYSLKFNLRDFTELIQTQAVNPFLWNQELRRDLVQVKVGQLNANLTKHNLDSFLDMVLFFEMLVTSKNEYQNKERFLKNKLKELNQWGSKTLDGQIKKKLSESVERYGNEKSKIDYIIRHVALGLVDENDFQFIQLNINGFRVIEILYENLGKKTELILENMDIISKLEVTEHEYKMVLSQDIKCPRQTPIFRLLKKQYPLQLYQMKWFVIDQLDLKLNPIVIKLTDELYDQFYNYFFDDDNIRKERLSSDKKEQIKTTTDNIGKQVPDYYHKLQIGELKVNASFRHPSKIKRFKDVQVVIEQYTSSKSFSTTKEQFDEFATFIIKQITSQIFSIIGQKLFG